MKPAIASFALAIVFCGQAVARKSLLGFALVPTKVRPLQ